MQRRQLFIGGGAAALVGGAAAYAGLRRMGSMDSYGAAVAVMREALAAQPDIPDFIRFATLAPNGHNTQPWLFRVGRGGIDIVPDLSRATSVVDPDNHHLFVALGCAAENLALAAGARDQPGIISFTPADGGVVTFAFDGGPPTDPALLDAIPRRQSTRADYDGRLVSISDLRHLTEAATVPGVDVALITDRPGIDRVRDLVVAGNSVQMGEAAFMQELKKWLRFSPRQALETGDGLFSAASGNPVLPAWLGPRLFDSVITAGSENDRYSRQFSSSPGLAIFIAHHGDPEHWVQAGRSCQRFALRATALGLKCAFVNQPVEVANLRPELASLAGMPGRRPDIMLRFGYGPTLAFSVRRPIHHVLIFASA